MILTERPRSCFAAEIGTIIFAVFNFILTSLCTILTVGGLIFGLQAMVGFINGGSGMFDTDRNDAIPATLGSCMILIILMMFSLVALVFAVFLLHGVVKKKPEHINAYFVYGVVVNVLSSVGVIIFTLLIGTITGKWGHASVLLILLVCIVYAFILAMIRSTYNTYRTLNEQYSHQLMQNEKF